MEEHRLTDRLTSYWNLIRKDDAMPPFEKFNLSAIGDMWQQCILFTVNSPAEVRPSIISFYKLGDRVKAMYGSDMAGITINPAMRHHQGASIVRKVESLIDQPQVLVDQGQFVNEKSKIVKYRSCLLPFGKQGRVTHILAGLSWREF